MSKLATTVTSLLVDIFEKYLVPYVDEIRTLIDMVRLGIILYKLRKELRKEKAQPKRKAKVKK